MRHTRRQRRHRRNRTVRRRRQRGGAYTNNIDTWIAAVRDIKMTSLSAPLNSYRVDGIMDPDMPKDQWATAGYFLNGSNMNFFEAAAIARLHLYGILDKDIPTFIAFIKDSEGEGEDNRMSILMNVENMLRRKAEVTEITSLVDPIVYPLYIWPLANAISDKTMNDYEPAFDTGDDTV